MTEKIKTLVLPDKLKDPFFFEDVLDVQNKLRSNSLVLDFSGISFIEPYSMISLLLQGRSFLRKSGNKIRLKNIPIVIGQYLTRMDFFKAGIFEYADEIKDKFFLKRSSFSKRVLEITEISGKERESIQAISGVISLFRKRASHILKVWFSDSITDSFVTVISELCQNIFEHSLDSGFLAMQTYTIGKENIVRLVISDSGIGIAKSFELRKDIRYDSEAHLIELALTTPISSKREFGYGLCQVKSIVERLNGTILIRSGTSLISAVYHRRKRGASHIFQKNGLVLFNGTQISISLYG